MNLRLIASILFLAVLPGYAQLTAKSSASDVISPARMRSILQGTGLEFAETSSDDAGAFAFQLNGHPVTLHSQAKSIQLSACFKEYVPLTKRAQWTREHFSTGVRVDEQGCFSLVANANYGGQVTDAMIADYVAGFLTDLTIYAKFVTDLPPLPDSPSGPQAAAPADHPTSPIGPMGWSQLGQNAKSAPPEPDLDGSVPGLVKINRNISLKYDPDRWKRAAPDHEGQFALAHSSGDAHAVIIAERISLPRRLVEDVALENAQSVDPNAKIVFRQQRRSNGGDVRFLKIEADVNKVPMVYWGCFYSGEYGTVEVVTYTTKSRLPDYEKDFIDFLDGLTVSK